MEGGGSKPDDTDSNTHSKQISGHQRIMTLFSIEWTPNPPVPPAKEQGEGP